MSDLTPGHDPNEAYEVVELAGAFRKPWDPLGRYLCLCNEFSQPIASRWTVTPATRNIGRALLYLRLREKNAGT